MKKFTKPTAPARIKSVNNVICDLFFRPAGAGVFFVHEHEQGVLFRRGSDL